MIHVRGKNIYPVVHCLAASDAELGLADRLMFDRIFHPDQLPLDAIEVPEMTDYVWIIKGDLDLSPDDAMEIAESVASYPHIAGLATPGIRMSPFSGSRSSVKTSRVYRRGFCDLSAALWHRTFFEKAKIMLPTLDLDPAGWSLPMQMGILAAGYKYAVYVDGRMSVPHLLPNLRAWSAIGDPKSVELAQQSAMAVMDAHYHDWERDLCFGYSHKIFHVPKQKAQQKRKQRAWEEVNIAPQFSYRDELPLQKGTPLPDMDTGKPLGEADGSQADTGSDDPEP